MIKVELAKRLNGIGEYYFSRKLAEIAELNKQGEPVINLGIGSPDRPPHSSVIETLTTEAAKETVHAPARRRRLSTGQGVPGGRG